MTKQRTARQEVIREIIRSRPVKTQKDLVDELKSRGYPCTQATISRDISELGLTKVSGGGIYVLSEDLRFQQMISTLVIDVCHAQNLVIVKSQTGAAQGVAAALDDTKLPQAMGTLAGDDTILVVCATEADAAALEETITTMCGSRS